MASEPFVSIVSPVLNHAKYIGECIESVQKQDYRNYEHIIVDNKSTDHTGIIAAHFARRDPRIRVIHNPRTVPMAENWNVAMRAMSPESVWCQVLHGDDMLYPGALRSKVDLGEKHPNVGIIGSLRRRGGGIECHGLPTDRQVFPGVQIGRDFLRKKVFAIAPSSGMLRSELVRGRKDFYPPEYLHCDLAAWLDLLDRTDFGFVHEILNFSRIHNNSITATVATRRRTIVREWFALLEQYGPRYFDAQELAQLKQEQVWRSLRTIIRGILRGESAEFVRYHIEGLQRAQLSGAARTLFRFLSSLIRPAHA